MIEYVLSSKEFSRLVDIEDTIEKLKSLNTNNELDSSIDTLIKKKDNIIDKYRKGFNFWTKESLNKFWRVHTSDSFVDLYIFPYEYIEDNGLLFSVYFYKDNNYGYGKSGLTDGSIEIKQLVNNLCNALCEEITMEMFEESVKFDVMNPLINRLKKLKLLQK